MLPENNEHVISIASGDRKKAITGLQWAMGLQMRDLPGCRLVSVHFVFHSFEVDHESRVSPLCSQWVQAIRVMQIR